MITGQYSQAWEIYESLQREFEKNPERVKQSQPVVYFALAEEAPRINRVKQQLEQERQRRAEVESEYSDTLKRLSDELVRERAQTALYLQWAHELEQRANALEEQQRPVELSFEPGEREALMELGWRKAV